MDNKGKKREKLDTDAILDLMNLIDDAYETLQSQKTTDTPNLIKENVMDNPSTKMRPS